MNGRRRALVTSGLGLVVAAHVASFAAPPMPPIHGDGTYTYYWARSLAFDGDLDLRNDYRLCGDPWGKLEPAAPGLGPRNTWSPGPAVLWVPVLLVARLVHPAARAADPRVAGACPTSPLAELAMVGTLLAGLATVWLTWRAARRHFGEGPALLGAMGVGLATTLPYYATLLPSYGHAPAAFAVALFLERWDATRGDRRLARWAGIGALLGLAMLMRAQCAVAALAPLLEWVGDARAARGRALAARLLAGVVFVAAALVLFFPQAWAWKVSYGSFLVVPQGAHYMRWDEPALDGVLFGSSGGLFTWTPITLIAFVGLAAGVARPSARPAALPFLLFALAFVYVNGAVWDWWGGASFGNRRFTELSLPFGFGLAAAARAVLAAAARRPHAVAGAAMAAALFALAGWNYAAMWAIAKAKIPAHVEGRSDVYARGVFAELSENVWRTVGNPLSWPASIPFALRYGTHPRRYDLLRGEGVFHRNFDTFELGPGEADVRLTAEPGLHYGARGFADGTTRVEGVEALVTRGREAALLLPLFDDDVAAVRLHWRAVAAPAGDAPRVTVRWNGREVARVDAPPAWAWTELVLPPGVPRTGINEVVLEAGGAPLALDRLSLVRRGAPAPAPPPAPPTVETAATEGTASAAPPPRARTP